MDGQDGQDFLFNMDEGDEGDFFIPFIHVKLFFILYILSIHVS